MNELTFEEKIQKIEEIVEMMDSGDESIESMLKYYENGIKLINDCKDFINKAELKFIELSKTETEL